MLAYLRHKIAVLVFGLVIPVCAFNFDYPGGVREIYNRVAFPYEYPQHTKHINVLLDADFGLTTASLAHDLAGIDAIMHARRDTDIVITVSDNRGGKVIVLELLQKAITQTAATVYIRLKHYGMSCGAFILKQGNLVFIPIDSIVLLHLGKVALSDDTELTLAQRAPPGLPKNLQQAWNAVVAREVAHMQPYRDWLSPQQYERILQGENVILTGKEICTTTNADVVMHTSDGCVIRGLKPSSPSFLDKLAIMKFAGY